MIFKGFFGIVLFLFENCEFFYCKDIIFYVIYYLFSIYYIVWYKG